MREFPAQLGVEAREPPYWERVLRTFGIRGQLPQLLLPTTQLGVTLADLTDPEYVWLGRTRQFWCGQSLGASVGNNSIGELQVSSFDALAVAYACARNTTAAFVNVQVGWALSLTGGLVNSSRVQAMDTRQDRGLIVPQFVPAFGAAVAAATPNAVQYNLSPNEYFEFGPFVISANSVGTGVGCLRIATSNTNIGLDLGFRWRERRQGQDET